MYTSGVVDKRFMVYHPRTTPYYSEARIQKN